MIAIEQADITPRVGETAGKVWHTLSSEGPLTMAQLKKKLDGSGDLLGLAIGWLAREDKVEITPEKKTLRVQLR
ncbi:MAG TPA: winged helix-turn-helix domain-containing protein [Terriglobia bacterium]|nr:winged helix-turn-helix domain-containing protein [Terriglobia bacterium]